MRGDTQASNANQTQLLSTGTLDFSVGSRLSNLRSNRCGSPRNEAGSLKSPPLLAAGPEIAPARDVVQQFSHRQEQESEPEEHPEAAMLSMTHMTSKSTETHQDFR